jgi:hypothetical protein
VVAGALALTSLGHGWLDGWPLVGVGGWGVLCLSAGLLFRRSAPLLAGMVFLGVEQAARLATGPSATDPWVPLYAAGFLFVAELAWWSIEPRVAAWWDLDVVVRRILVVVCACFGAAVLAGLVMVAAGAPIAGGVELELVGVVAATAALVLVAVVARTHRFG